MDLYLDAKTAVVTGASQGIGRAIAKQLAAEGVTVFATARNRELLDSLKQEITRAGGKQPLLFTQDLAAAAGSEQIAAAAQEQLGQVDILVNNAGKSNPLHPLAPEADWQQSMVLDFYRVRQLTEALLPHFMERKEGVILNLCSGYELKNLNASAVAKAAVVSWSKALASELGPAGIRVNCLQPGLIDTDNIRPFFPGRERQLFAEREIPLGDFGSPEDMANMAAFLVSPRARYMTGTVAVVDGGLRRYPF
ncbi:3-oxoacyl-ACP reductase [Pedobacter yulinensis]|uniref:3-oxoacyl-ACP reductase n=1 Tax=Pedobacter yulinensis TaxID=2126353 RepID=A0A2T3HJH3_9SPHI|nr:SDR family oxidoreductase [Pedobacter yulinensis]PST82587.1 3-oxoacyl-ACP reductase [Pedobacter yulinensis]